MTNPQNQKRRVFAGLLATIVATGVTTLAVGTPAAYAEPGPDSHALKESPVDTLGSHDLDLLAEAQARGEKTVMLIVATDKGESGDVAGALKKLGGTVAKRVDQVGYVRASVPTGAVLQGGQAARRRGHRPQRGHPAAEARADRGPRPGRRAGGAPSAAPGADTPADNPYMPTGRDRRGRLQEGAPDLGRPRRHDRHPGRRRRPRPPGAADHLDRRAEDRRLGHRHRPAVRRRRHLAADADRRSPAPRSPRRGQTGRRRAPARSSSTGSTSRSPPAASRAATSTATATPPTCSASSTTPATHDIWVDVNQDRDFTDDGGAMRPYARELPGRALRHRQPGHRRSRADAVRRRVPRGRRRHAGRAARASPTSSTSASSRTQHGSHVAGITAANNMFGNDNLDGAAPGAKLVSARACTWGGGCTAAALTDGMIDLVVNRHVDVVNMSIGGLPALNDGNNARAELYNRLIDDYGVQMFISAGNSGPGLNTIGDPAVADGRRQRGRLASARRPGWPTTASGHPRAVPAVQLLLARPARGRRLQAEHHRARLGHLDHRRCGSRAVAVAEAGYALPPGYAMFNGTSMASPQAAGGVAAAAVRRPRPPTRTSPRPQLRRAISTLGGLHQRVSRRRAGQRPARRRRRLERCSRRAPGDRGATPSPRRCARRSPTSWPRRTGAPASTTGAPPARAGSGRRATKTYTVQGHPHVRAGRATSAQPRWVGNDGTVQRAQVGRSCR